MTPGRWSLTDILQGKPIGHPTHALFVHFPSALFPVAFILAVISRVDADVTVARAGFYNIAFGLGFAVLAAFSGLLDYLSIMGGGTQHRLRLGTFHILFQVTAVSLMSGALAVHAFDYDAARTPWPAVALAGAGSAALGTGNYLGGSLVYKEGMRVASNSRSEGSAAMDVR